MLDNSQENKRNLRTPLEVIGGNKKAFFVVVCFLILLTAFCIKTQSQTDLDRKNGVRPWYEDEKYAKQEKFGIKTPLVADTFISSKGILMMGTNKYEETVTLTKIK
jgi:hypothetical protein